jgi:hypothetical protein
MRKSKAEGAPRRSFWGFILSYGERRRQLFLEDQLREGISEKNGLLFELNHRVKNNLPIMEGHFDA